MPCVRSLQNVWAISSDAWLTILSMQTRRWNTSRSVYWGAAASPVCTWTEEDIHPQREIQRELWHIYVQIAVLGHAVHLLTHLLSVDISPLILWVQSSIYISIHPYTFLTFVYLFIHHHCPFNTDRGNKSIRCGHCGIRLGLWCQDGWHNKGKSNTSNICKNYK